MTVPIHTENLTRSFGPSPAVNRITFQVQKAEIFGLIGPDGAGKTTLMRMLTGILCPSDGDAWILGHSISAEPEQLKARIGYMPQRFALYGDLTVMENIRFYADLYAVPKGERAGRIPRLLDFSQLAPFQHRRAGDLSGGMKQKLGLACALIHTPEVLFLDEPTNGIDPISRREFWRLLYELLADGVTILVSTAYLDEAERCHRIGLMHQGNLRAAGPVPEIMARLRKDIWEIRCPDRMRARDLIGSLPMVESVSLFGDRIHAVWGGGDETRRNVENAIREAGFHPCSVKKIPPRLEDLFLHDLLRNWQEDSGTGEPRR